MGQSHINGEAIVIEAMRMRTPSDDASSRELIRMTFAATIVFAGLGVVSPAGNLEASVRLSTERFDLFSAHQTVRRKSSRSGATWTALEGIFSCSTKKKAVELAELMVQAKGNWRLVDNVRDMIGSDAESECERVQKIRLEFSKIEFVRKVYDHRKIAALVFHPRPPSGLSLKESIDQQIDAMNSAGSPDSTEAYYVLARPALVDWIFEPATRTH